MNRDEIHLGGCKRILFGEAPLEFSAEVLLRTVFIYVLLLIALRLLGKRMNGQLTLTEPRSRWA
jgi:predicted membrane chloride channel (bestrophin family)